MTPLRLCLLFLLIIPKLSAASSITVLGDSLSAAYGINPSQGWVHLISQRLQQHQYHYSVINASISGETSAGGRQRITALLERHQPSLLILALGANDGLRGLPIEQLYQNLQYIIELSQQRGVSVLLIGIRLPTNYGPHYNQRFSDVYRHLADRYKLPLIPFLLAGLEQKPHLFQADGLHPTAQAQVIIANNIWPTLAAALN